MIFYMELWEWVGEVPELPRSLYIVDNFVLKCPVLLYLGVFYLMHNNRLLGFHIFSIPCIGAARPCSY